MGLIPAKRHSLRFNCLDDIHRHACSLVAAEKLRQKGNWSAGQAFEHLAKSLHSSIDESLAILPLKIRIVARLFRPVFLHYALPSGVKIESKSSVAAEEFLPSSDVSDEEGLRLLEQAIARVRSTEMTARHNLFGWLTQRQWAQLHCRHAELHFGFFSLD